MLFFFFGSKCLGINSLLSLYVIERFRVFCLFVSVFLIMFFHSHLGILDAGQLVGFLGCWETSVTLLGAILATLKLETYTVTLLRCLSILSILP